MSYHDYINLFPDDAWGWVDRLTYPRRYRNREGLVPSQDAARICGSLMFMDPHNKEVSQMLQVAIDSLAGLLALTKWTDHQAIQYNLNRSLGEALMRTRVNTELDYTQLQLPLPGMLVHLPTGLIEAQEGPVRFVLMGIADTERLQYRTTSGMFPAHIEATGLPRLMVWTLVDAEEEAPAYGASIPLMGSKLNGYLDGQAMGSMSYSRIDDADGGYKADFASPSEIQESDSKTILQLVGLALNIMALHQARPATFAKECEVLRRERRKRDKVVKPALFELREIGRHYKPLSRSSSSSTPLTDLDRVGRESIWVSGYWRSQPYGPGRALRRAKWVEPYQRVI
jgi:hypothetical protein